MLTHAALRAFGRVFVTSSAERKTPLARNLEKDIAALACLPTMASL
jgi:hypothetical protein